MGLIKALCRTMCCIVMLILLCIAAFVFACMNIFTLPLFALCWSLCKFMSISVPHIAFYSLMSYPAWGNKKYSFVEHVGKIIKTRIAKRKPYYPMRAWEERFFD